MSAEYVDDGWDGVFAIPGGPPAVMPSSPSRPSWRNLGWLTSLTTSFKIPRERTSKLVTKGVEMCYAQVLDEERKSELISAH